MHMGTSFWPGPWGPCAQARLQHFPGHDMRPFSMKAKKGFLLGGESAMRIKNKFMIRPAQVLVGLLVACASSRLCAIPAHLNYQGSLKVTGSGIAVPED